MLSASAVVWLMKHIAGASPLLTLRAPTPGSFPACPPCQVVSWAGTSPDGRAVTGSLPTMKQLFNPNNTDED